jgi:hypothetical protein
MFLSCGRAYVLSPGERKLVRASVKANFSFGTTSLAPALYPRRERIIRRVFPCSICVSSVAKKLRSPISFRVFRVFRG